MTQSHTELRRDQLQRLIRAAREAVDKLNQGKNITELDEHLHPRCLKLAEFVVVDGKDVPGVPVL
jgi:hypothetical protein